MGTLTLVSIKDRGATAATTDDTTYLGVALADFDGNLVGLDDVLVFHAYDVDALLNKATDSTPATPVAKLDWSTFGNTGLDLSAALTALNGTSLGDLTASVDLAVDGGVALNVLDGLVVLKAAGFQMQIGQVSGHDATTTLTNAQAMTVTLTGVTLWVGPGGSLDSHGTVPDVTNATSFSDDEVVAGDIGFSGFGGSRKLVSLKNTSGTPAPGDDTTYLALDISGVNASLVGLEDVLAFNAWNIGVLVNKA